MYGTIAKISVSSAFVALLAWSCSSPYEPDETSAVRFVEQTGNFTLNLNLGSVPKDVYFAFTNIGTSESSGIPTVSSSVARGIAPEPPPATRSLAGANAPRRVAQRGTPEIAASSKELAEYLARSGRSLFPGGFAPSAQTWGGAVTEGTTTFDFKTDFLDNDAQTRDTVPTTLRKAVLNVSTSMGAKDLYIWVEDDSWHAGGTKTNLVTQEMVDMLAEIFLQAGGNDNDIYDWVTNIFGEEWGSHVYEDLIGPNDEINIVLFDISNDDSTDGGVLGYYWALDNFEQNLDAIYYQGTDNRFDSNEMVVFALDSVLLATPEGTWDETDYWPREIVSTLAHEFQHMIGFYQKSVLVGTGGFDTWIEEMLSMVAEDLVADKIQADGPRGVAYDDYSAGSSENESGRLPLFNLYADDSLTEWLTGDEVLRSYSIAYSFGAYMLRALGGIDTIQAMYANSDTGGSSVAKAVSKVLGREYSFAGLMRMWMAAVMLSDRTDLPPELSYNKGGAFSFVENGMTYTVGSINLHNYSQALYDGNILIGYQHGPWINSGNSVTYQNAPIKGEASSLYLAGTGLSGSVSWTVSLPDDVRMGVVFR